MLAEANRAKGGHFVGGSYIEFPRREAEAEGDGDGVFPICWFRFDSVDQSATLQPTGELRVKLHQPRSLRYLLMLLITPEDRMEAMDDDHPDPNIDLEYCGLSGWHA